MTAGDVTSVPHGVDLACNTSAATDPVECVAGPTHVNGTATGVVSTNPLGGVLPGGMECVWIVFLPDVGASVRLTLQAMSIPNSATLEIRDGQHASSPLLARIDNTRNVRVSGQRSSAEADKHS